MLARLMRDGGMLFLVLGIYFAVNAALRLVLPVSLELEESRQLFLSQWLAPGYGGQAPLHVWLQHGAVQLVGTNVLAIALLQNLLLFSSYLLVGAAAFLVIRNRALAIIAVLGMLLLPQIAYELQRDAGSSVAVLAAAGLFICGLFGMLERGSLFAYALVGLASGAGLLASYGFALLPAAAAIAVVAEPSFRARLWNWRIIATLLAFAASVSPHAFWLRDHAGTVAGLAFDQVTASPAGDRGSQIIEGLFSLGVALFGFCAPVLLVFWISFGRRFHQSWRASSRWTRLVGLILSLAVVALTLLVVLGGAPKIRDRWLIPFFFMLPLYLSLKLDALNQTIGNAPKRFGMIVVAIMVAVPLALVARTLAPHWNGRYGNVNIPYRPAIDGILARGPARPTLVLAEDALLAGNIRFAAPGLTVVVPGNPLFDTGYEFDEAHPLLMIWRNGEDLPETLAALLAAQVEAGAVRPEPSLIAVPYHFGKRGDVYRFGYAWIHPPTP